jgi:hypothetical protein
MKRIILSSSLLLAFCLTVSARNPVMEGKTNSLFGDFRIEATGSTVTICGKEMKAFQLSYDNSDLKAVIAVNKSGKCTKYYVLNENLSVQYVCDNGFLGVERLDEDVENEGYKASDTALNRAEYFHQKVLTRGDYSDMENIRLIASYFPFLLNENKL